MSRTRRKNFRGEDIQEGDPTKKCPSANCERCVNRNSKKPHRRRIRRAYKQKKDQHED